MAGLGMSRHSCSHVRAPCRASPARRSCYDARPLRRMGEGIMRAIQGGHQPRCKATGALNASIGEEVAKSEEYSDVMQSRMGGTLTYRHEDGMNYAHVLPDLIVGSCLQTAADVDRLAEAGVGTIMCLQEDCDMDWFQLDLEPILRRAAERGDIVHVRHRVRDFDPFSLRQELPEAVQKVAAGFASGRGKVYIHCTAGMGRAPGLALAYMFWCRGFELQQANAQLLAVRHCHPKLSAIREATCDVLYSRHKTAVSIRLPLSWAGGAKHIQIAGLDVGWGNRLDMELDPGGTSFVLRRELPPGKFNYKFLYDGHWSYSANHPSIQDGDNINNYVEVLADPSSTEARARLMAEDGRMTEEERSTIAHFLEGLPA